PCAGTVNCGGTTGKPPRPHDERASLALPGGLSVERIWTIDLPQHAGEQVELAGWLHRLRRLSAVTFLILRDGRGTAQIVVADPATIERLAALNLESVLRVRGRAVTNEQAPGGVELHDAEVEIIAPAAEPPPFDLFRPVLKAQLPTLLDHAAVGLRHPPRRAAFRIAAAAVAGFRDTLDRLGFVEIH